LLRRNSRVSGKAIAEKKRVGSTKLVGFCDVQLGFATFIGSRCAVGANVGSRSSTCPMSSATHGPSFMGGQHRVCCAYSFPSLRVLGVHLRKVRDRSNDSSWGAGHKVLRTNEEIFLLPNVF